MAPSRPFQPTRAAFAAVLLALFALLVSFSPVSAQKEDVSPYLATPLAGPRGRSIQHTDESTHLSPFAPDLWRARAACLNSPFDSLPRRPFACWNLVAHAVWHGRKSKVDGWSLE